MEFSFPSRKSTRCARWRGVGTFRSRTLDGIFVGACGIWCCRTRRAVFHVMHLRRGASDHFAPDSAAAVTRKAGRLRSASRSPLPLQILRHFARDRSCPQAGRLSFAEGPDGSSQGGVQSAQSGIEDRLSQESEYSKPLGRAGNRKRVAVNVELTTQREGHS